MPPTRPRWYLPIMLGVGVLDLVGAVLMFTVSLIAGLGFISVGALITAVAVFRYQTAVNAENYRSQRFRQ